MNIKKPKNLGIFLACIAGIACISKGMCDFESGGEIGFLMIYFSISCILVISFSLILVMTWDRWLLRIVSFIFLLTTFFVSKISNFEFSFMEAIIISVSMTVMPLLVTFIFYKKERMEKLRKRGYHLEPIEYLDGNFGEEILVLYGKDMDIIHVDKHYKEIL